MSKMAQLLRNFVLVHQYQDSQFVLKGPVCEACASKALSFKSLYLEISFWISGCPRISGASLLNATSVSLGRSDSGMRQLYERQLRQSLRGQDVLRI